MYSIKQIASAETFIVRQPVLRPGKPVESCIFEGDDLNSTVHFGIFNNGVMAGCISVFKSGHTIFNHVNGQFQLRGMAIIDTHQGKGLGKMLLTKAEDYITENNGKVIWCNARETAAEFYTKNGYNITGLPFIIEGIGTHYVMHKYL